MKIIQNECINGSTVNGVREPILFSFALHKTLGDKIYKEFKINFSETFEKAVLSHNVLIRT